MSDPIVWLMQWYLSQCDNDWEHSYGIKIDNLDNPGWMLKIDLRETDLEGRPFVRIARGEPSSDLEDWKRTGSWLIADVKGNCFEGACGPLDLPGLINIFREWVEA